MKSAWITVLSIIAICVAAVSTFNPSVACADSWSMPGTETTESASGQYRFTVEPAPIESQLSFFAEEARAEREGQQVERPTPIGLLERKNGAEVWEPVWAGPLVNHVAPVSALVADDGRYVVTFDNWHSVGRGENVIVIYGPDGSLVRSMALTDLLPETYISALSHSVSSTSWQHDAKIEAGDPKLRLDIYVPGSDPYGESQETVTFWIELEEASVTPPRAAQWAAAQCAAEDINEQRERAEEERLAYFRNPLTIPNGCEMSQWHNYLNEAFMRLAPDWSSDPFTSTTVLFPSDHPRYEESVSWLRNRLLDHADYARAESFAEPCDGKGLVPAVRSIMDGVGPGSLSEATFYVSTTRDRFDEVSRIVEPSGAKTVWLDPDAAIPQRPERIPGSDEQKAAEEERFRRIDAEMGEILSEAGT